jgi:D-xylose transport system substrate-binding protein
MFGLATFLGRDAPHVRRHDPGFVPELTHGGPVQERTSMSKRYLGAAGVVAATLLLAACGSSSNGSSSSSATSSGSGATTGKVGVILPDATTSPRWESSDRPSLQKAFDAAGITYDIQNATKDTTKFGSICDAMIAEKVNVLMIVNLDSASGAACESKAKAAGIPSIDYDRLTLNGDASYYVSFDNVQVGKLMGQGLVDCLTAAGKTKANVAEVDGDPTDNNAKLFAQGYNGVLQPKVAAGDYKIVADQTGKWDATVAQTVFEQMYAQNQGKIDGVLVANDTMAGGVNVVLTKNGLAGKVPITGQDASDEGLQRVLAGTQCGTVFKDTTLEANLAAKLAIGMIKGDGSDKTTATDTINNQKVTIGAAYAVPVWITKANIKVPFDAGYTTAAKVCTGSTAALCTAAGIS